MRADDGVAVVDDEAGNAAYAHAVDLLDLGPARVAVPPRGKPFAGVAGHARLLGEDDQRQSVVDIDAIAEISAEQALDHGVGAAGEARPANEAVGVDRVRGARDLVE